MKYWIHKKGGIYKVLSYQARLHNSIDILQVLYKSLKTTNFPKGTIWIRDFEDFAKSGSFRPLTKWEYLLLKFGFKEYINFK